MCYFYRTALSRAICAAIALLCAGVLGAHAEAVARYTVDDCLRIGLDRSVAVVNARRGEDIAAAQVREARSRGLPQLTGNLEYSRLDELQEFDIGSGPISLGSLNNYVSTFTVEQTLYSGGRVMAAIRAAAMAKQYARLGTERAEAELIRDIKTGFNNVLLARAAMSVARESMVHLRDMSQQAERMFKSGTASEFDSLTARVRLANEVPKLLAASNAVDTASKAFGLLVNFEEHDFELVGDLAYAPLDADLPSLQKRAQLHRPELLELESLTGMMQEHVVITRSAARPYVSARFNYNGANSYQLVAFDSDWEWHWNAAVTAKWSLFDGGRTRGAVAQKRIELAQRLADLEQMRKAVSLGVRQAYLDKEQAAGLIAGGDKTVDLAERALTIAKTRYASGAGTAMELADANLALNTAKLARYQALCDHMNAVIGLRYAVGMEANPATK